MILEKIATIAKNSIAPPFCFHCKLFLDADSVFCVDCLLLIRPIVSKQLPLTKKYSIVVYAISDYQDPLKSLILAKGSSNRAAAVSLAQLIWDHTVLKNQIVDCIIPIPLHWMRYAWRGYNQAEEMALVLSKKAGVSIINALKRSKRTNFQSLLTYEKRFENIKDCFQVKTKYKNEIKGKHIVLVDDLMTSGATLQTAARVLRKYKPASIRAVVACRVV